MKFSALITIFVAACVSTVIASADVPSIPTDANANANKVASIASTPTSHENDTPMTPQQALEAAQTITPPAGIVLTGTTEPIEKPANFDAVVKDKSSSTTTEDKDEAHAAQEWWGGISGGWGSWGGWGGFGPYRFGYSCGGLGGWAYPLGYWNAFGSGLWGGGCGLGLAYGGLFYC